jgi:hypothetical protein
MRPTRYDALTAPPQPPQLKDTSAVNFTLRCQNAAPLPPQTVAASLTTAITAATRGLIVTEKKSLS